MSFGSRLTVAPESMFGMRPRCGLVETSACLVVEALEEDDVLADAASSARRPGPNSMAAPLPLAHQCVGSTPLEK